MPRREFLKTVSLGLALAPTRGLGRGAGTAQDSGPNIIFIIADDP